MRRAGELTGLGDDLFFLELPETFDLGVVEGTARVLRTPEDADQLGDGDQVRVDGSHGTVGVLRQA